MSNMRGDLITPQTVLNWLSETYSHVVEYSTDLKRAYTEDEDDDDGAYYIPVAIVRQLISEEKITIWRYIGQWNRGYHTYRPTWWVKAWKREHPDSADIDVTAIRLDSRQPLLPAPDQES